MPGVRSRSIDCCTIDGSERCGFRIAICACRRGERECNAANDRRSTRQLLQPDGRPLPAAFADFLRRGGGQGLH